MIELEPYTYDQFYEIAVQQLKHRYGAIDEMAEAIRDAVWRKSQDIKDCTRVGTMAKSLEDVDFIVEIHDDKFRCVYINLNKSYLE